jgi:hypothetical protein
LAIDLSSSTQFCFETMGGAFLQVSGYELSMQASQKVYTRVAAISLFDLM